MYLGYYLWSFFFSFQVSDLISVNGVYLNNEMIFKIVFIGLEAIRSNVFSYKFFFFFIFFSSTILSLFVLLSRYKGFVQVSDSTQFQVNKIEFLTFSYIVERTVANITFVQIPCPIYNFIFTFRTSTLTSPV